MKEYIAPGVSDEDFVARVRNALAPTADSSQAQSSAQPAGNASTESSGQATPSSAVEQESSTVQALLAERAVKMEAQRKKEAEDAKIRRKAKAEAKAAEAAKTGVSDPQSKHVEAVKRKRKEAQDERQRILQAIADDKAARKARQVEREAERKAAWEAENQEGTPLQASPAPSTKLPSMTRTSEHCYLQVRLFDGSTIRNRFPSDSRLGTEVRAWIDANRMGDKQPYLFKVVLSPLPNKNVETSEERQSLQDVGLTPSATLILVPPPKSAAGAYPGNPVSRLIAFIMACITGFFGLITTFFTTMFSSGGAASQQSDPAASQTRSASGRDQGSIRGARERRNDQQFYNGNSVCRGPLSGHVLSSGVQISTANFLQTNFEPRRDDEED